MLISSRDKHYIYILLEHEEDFKDFRNIVALADRKLKELIKDMKEDFIVYHKINSDVKGIQCILPYLKQKFDVHSKRD